MLMIGLDLLTIYYQASERNEILFHFRASADNTGLKTLIVFDGISDHIYLCYNILKYGRNKK